MPVSLHSQLSTLHFQSSPLSTNLLLINSPTQKHQPITLLPEAPVFCTSPSQASPLQPGKQQAYALLIDTLRIFRSRKFPESIQNLDITIYLKIITPFFISSRSFCIRQQALRKASRTMPSLLISALRNLPNSS